MIHLGKGSSYGKIIVIGEHAVVHNKPAIALPFKGLETIVNIYKTNDEISIKSQHYNGYINNDSNKIKGIKTLVASLLKHFNNDFYGFHLEIISNNIAGRGLGSSAAVSVAIVKAFFNAFNSKYEDDDLIKFATLAEQIHHTNPSGLDVATLVYNEPIWYVKNKAFKRIDLNFKGSLLIIDSGLESQTKIAVEHVGKLYQEKYETTKTTFDEIERLTYKALEALLNNDFTSLEKTFIKGQKCLESLEISNDQITGIIKIANAIGIKGIKITGGGMGGCLIALANDHNEALKVKEKLLEKGIPNVWIHSMGE